MIPVSLVSMFARLHQQEHRQQAARELAHYARVKAVFLFNKEEEGDRFLPAVPFPCTMENGGIWRSFLDICAGTVRVAKTLPDPESGEATPVLGLSDADGLMILVFVGGQPEEDEIDQMQSLLALSAAAYAAAARDHEIRTESLHKTLRLNRQDLQAAFERADREIAHRRDAENRLRVADRRKDEFLATVSHELRTPLNAILGWAELLRIKINADPALQKGIDAIIRSAKTQSSLINDLLDTSSITACKTRLHLEEVDLKEVLERARETIEPDAQQKRIRIESDCVAADPLTGDATRLRQVFWNLLSNAVKFTPAGGSISIHTQRDPGWVEVAIADTGLGIEKNFLPYVFDRFRQADASLRRKYGGLGLGLAIAKQLVELHGGTIHVSSEGTGKGTTFTVRLPTTLARSSRNFDSDGFPARIGPRGMPNLRSVHVLAVDDDPDAREVLRKMLQDFGARVEAASSAAEALATLKAKHFDVLVSDISMPGMDGITFIKTVRNLPDGERANIPALALTAFSESVLAGQAKASGFQVLMTKPVVAIQLGHAISALSVKKPR